MRQVYGTKVTRLTLGGLSSCPPGTGVLPAPQDVGMGRQKSAEAVVAGSTKPAKGRTSSTGGGRSVDDDSRCRRWR